MWDTVQGSPAPLRLPAMGYLFVCLQIVPTEKLDGLPNSNNPANAYASQLAGVCSFSGAGASGLESSLSPAAKEVDCETCRFACLLRGLNPKAA